MIGGNQVMQHLIGTVSQSSNNIQILVMQKSMVQELNLLSYSTVFSSRPSFISTHISDPQVNELRRSRIHNLPGYKKEDLSTKLNFVVVFQTIEIERLSQEIQSLRVKCRDWDRQRLNYENYQVQIRELTERCHIYQVQREGLNEESQKMKLFCEKLYRQFQEYKAKFGQGEIGMKEKYNLERQRSEQLQAEVEKWRNRFTGLERSKAKQMEEMRGQFEAQRKSALSRQLRQATVRYEAQLQGLVGQLRKVREEAQWRAGQGRRLQQIVDRFALREEEMKDVETKMLDFENRFVMLSQENYRLNELIRWKVEQIQRLRGSQKELKARLQANKALEQETARLREETARYRRETEEVKISSARSGQQIERLRVEGDRLRQVQRQFTQSSGEIQRLNGLMHSKIKELDEARNNLRVFQTKFNAVNNASQRQFASYQEKIVSYTKELERLSAQLKNRLTENETLKGRITDLERGSARMESLQKQNEQLKNQSGQALRRSEEMKARAEQLEESLKLMGEVQKRLQEQQQYKRQLIEERERLNANVRNLTLQLETTNRKLITLEFECAQYGDISGQIRSYQQRLAWMTQQLDKLKSQLQARVGELYQLRESIKTMSNGKQLNQQIEQRLLENLSHMQALVLELDNSRRENERLHNDNITMESNLRKLQGDVMYLNQEREENSRLLQEKSSEMQRMNQQIQSMTARVAENRELSQLNQEQQKQLDILKTSHQQIEQRYRTELKRSESFSADIEKLSAQILELRQESRVPNKMIEEVVILRRSCEEKSMMISGLIRRIQGMEQLLRGIKQRCTGQYQFSQDLGRRAQAAMRQMGSVDELIALVHRYADQLNKVSEQNVMLQSQRGLNQVEMCQSLKVLESGTVQQGNSLLTTFGQPAISYKNESIAYGLTPNEFSQGNENLFTFKDVSGDGVMRVQTETREVKVQGGGDGKILGREANRAQTWQIRGNSDRGEEGEYREQSSQINSLNDARDTNSMASSFINTLISKQSVGRFQRGHNETQNVNNPGFGKNVTVTRTRYVTSSPSPPNSPNTHNYGIRYVGIESTVDDQGQSYTNPFQQGQALIEGAGVKRVSSETHFTGYSGRPSAQSGYMQIGNMQMGQMQGQVQMGQGQVQISQMQPQMQMGQMSGQVLMGQGQVQMLGQGRAGQQDGGKYRDNLRIRVLQVAQSPNIVSSTNVTSTQLGKPIRLKTDSGLLSPSFN